MTVSTNSYVLGLSGTDTNNFLLDTDGAGSLRIRRKSDGSGGTVLTVDSNNKITSGLLTLGTSQATTSGTSIDFTGIPSWVKRVTVMLNGVSTNGASSKLIQLGSGSVATTGYDSTGGYAGATNSAGAATSTAGFILYGNQTSDSISGNLILVRTDSNTWVCSYVLKELSTTLLMGGGSVTLSDTLDRLRLTTVNGTDTFDAGSMNILYEG